MRVAVVGAGFTGLSAAVALVDAGIKVEVFEKSDKVGGLASGFKTPQWNTTLEKYYHHIFANDKDIIEMATKVGLPPIFFTPLTCSLIDNKVFQLDSAISVLKFTKISFYSRLRMGFGLALLKVIPNGLFLEKYLVVDFLPKLIGAEAYKTIWKKLLKAKFGKKMNIVNMAWFWSRVAKRTKSLGYFDGGFQALADKMADYVKTRGGIFHLKSDFGEASNKKKHFFNKVIITTPAPVANSLIKKSVMPKINYLWAQTLVLELKHSLMDSYWLNILETKWPFLVAVEHTRLVNKSGFNNKSILYFGNYLPENNKQLSMSKNKLLDLYLPFIKKINSKFSRKWITNSFVFRSPYAQPVFPVNYSKALRGIVSQNGKYYFANMSMVYPFDRGTNYAVKLGVDTTKKCLLLP